MAETPYVELTAKSAFSFMDGTATPEALIEAAGEVGYGVIGLADRADVGGVVRFVQEGIRRGIEPVVGAAIPVGGRPVDLIVQSKAGWRNLCSLVTRSRSAPRGRPSVTMEDLCGHAEGLHLLTGGPSGPVAAPLLSQEEHTARRNLQRLMDAFGSRVAVEVQYHYVSGHESDLAGSLIEIANQNDLPWVVTNEPRYISQGGRIAHDALVALSAGVTVDEARQQGLLLPNGQWRLRSAVEMKSAWAGREAGLRESVRIASESAFELDWVHAPLPRFHSMSDAEESAFLRARTYEGAFDRWGEPNDQQRRQLDHELAVIERLGYAGYFLIVWDAVRFARSRGILCQGRGSAANSAVAYCLGITSVDPVANRLLFERFLSESRTDGRAEPPDIDVDFEMDRREEVFDYVYGRYDREHAALTGMIQTFHAPSALQDLARAFGYPVGPVRAASKRLRHHTTEEGALELASGLAEAHGLDLSDPRGRAMLSAMAALDEVPRIRATHPGGFVVSGEPLGTYMPIEKTASGRTILQFDKEDLDAVGVPKFDILGLGGLTAIRLATDAIRKRTGIQLELYELPLDDPATFEMIRAGDTVGTFQIESRAQIQSILRTQPETYYDLVVQVALIRPGPIQADIVHPYIRRRRCQEPVTYAHPDLEPILARTQGIPLFQEQAMSIAMEVAGYSGDEAYALRRTMGSEKKRPRLLAALEQLRDRLQAQGIEPEAAEEITSALTGQSGYAFAESHAFAFGALAYATAYLKAHYPAEFYLALLNAWPMGFYPPATLVHEARRRGINVRPPCVVNGEWYCTTEDSDHSADFPSLRIGWKLIRGLGESAAERMRSAQAEQPFSDVEDLIRRAGLDRREAMILARAGALEAFEPGRRAAAWAAMGAAADTLPLAPIRTSPAPSEEQGPDELVFLDYLATGICVRGHPMEHVRERLDRGGAEDSKTVGDQKDGASVVVAGLVVVRQRPQTAKGTVFLLLEDEHGFINVVVPAWIYDRFKEVINHSPVLVLRGRVERDDQVLNVVGERFKRLKFRSEIDSESHSWR